MRLHETGQWCKKNRGRTHYFGSDNEAALKPYEAERTDLEAAGLRRADPGALTVKGLANEFPNASSLLILVAMAGHLTADDPDGDARKGLDQLRGEWVAVSFEANGEAVPTDKAGWHVVVTGEKVSIRFGIVRYEIILVAAEGRKNPRLDVTRTTGEGLRQGAWTRWASIRWTKPKLTVCYRFTKDGGSRPTAFDAGRGSDAMMQVFKRSK